jgi:hypothetical protein
LLFQAGIVSIDYNVQIRSPILDQIQYYSEYNKMMGSGHCYLLITECAIADIVNKTRSVISITCLAFLILLLGRGSTLSSNLHRTISSLLRSMYLHTFQFHP